MLNKALLMAVAVKKKAVVPTNGVFYGKFSITTGEFWMGIGASTMPDAEFGTYTPISGSDMSIEGMGVIVMTSQDVVTVFSSPHLLDEAFLAEEHICGVVNDDTGEVFYGNLGPSTADSSFGSLGWLVCCKSYDDAKALSEDPWADVEVALPFYLDDVGKTYTFSFYICD